MQRRHLLCTGLLLGSGVAAAQTALPRFTVSAGVAEFPADGAELLPLIAAADARLYEAKHAGRNCVR